MIGLVEDNQNIARGTSSLWQVKENSIQRESIFDSSPSRFWRRSSGGYAFYAWIIINSYQADRRNDDRQRWIFQWTSSSFSIWSYSTFEWFDSSLLSFIQYFMAFLFYRHRNHSLLWVTYKIWIHSRPDSIPQTIWYPLFHSCWALSIRRALSVYPFIIEFEANCCLSWYWWRYFLILFLSSLGPVRQSHTTVVYPLHADPWITIKQVRLIVSLSSIRMAFSTAIILSRSCIPRATVRSDYEWNSSPWLLMNLLLICTLYPHLWGVSFCRELDTLHCPFCPIPSVSILLPWSGTPTALKPWRRTFFSITLKTNALYSWIGDRWHCS